MAIYNAYNMAFIYGNIYGYIYIYIIYTDFLTFSMVKMIDLLTFSLINDWYKHYKWYESSSGNR